MASAALSSASQSFKSKGQTSWDLLAWVPPSRNDLNCLASPSEDSVRTPKEIEGIASFAGESQFSSLLSGLHVLIKLLPITPDTTGVMNRQTFAQLALGAYVINLGAAGLVEADGGRSSSGDCGSATFRAMLDVFSNEPLASGHTFWRLPRISVIAYISALTRVDKAVLQVSKKMMALGRGEVKSGLVYLSRGN
ncbi:NAD(P)-dependent oxidoreductase [Cupriavidus basilensis]